LEALAAGTPIISTRVGGIPDIADDKKNGLLVEARDPHALARAIETMIASREAYSSFSAHALEKTKSFSFDRMLRETLALYTQRT
jgi:glycosyltransferase involved in cell wall biosynthesis